jgi:hypoxanthine-DNA glycosylase
MPAALRVNALAQGLAPVIDAGVHTLILGSFPSQASLARGQYYGHPRNHFWPLLQAVLGEPLAGLPYERRLETLLVRGIGLWDVIGRCDRPGSLDSNIRRAERNAFDALLGSLPRLQRVFFNGATAGRAATAFAARGLAVRVLPSSSPALTTGFPAKLAAWASIAEPVVCPAPDRPVRRA